ncbi:MAG: hypothetical protein J6K12_05140 [Clostridia bacterium]|nr:hypothetical protein [Clostridia bacterium]
MRQMFQIKTEYLDTSIGIEFPCSNSTLYAKLAELHMPDEEKIRNPLFVKEIDYEELKGLEGQFIDPDVLNFIAQKLDSFDHKELKKFNAIVRTYTIDTPRELVNLTYNMHYYTLIEDMSNVESIGRTHMLTREQALSADNSEGYDFYKIGQELMELGTGKLTQYGIIFVNDDLEYEKPYVGKSLPAFEYDSSKLVTIELMNENKSAYVYLPDCPFTIERAVNRIEAESVENCKVYVDGYNIEEGYERILGDVLEKEGVHALNNLVSEIAKLDRWRLYDFKAIIEYADVSDSESIIRLAQNINCFIVYDEVDNAEELGREWLDLHDEYYIHSDLRDFFNYEEYGEYLTRNLEGKFLGASGFVGIKEEYDLKEILGEEQEQE